MAICDGTQDRAQNETYAFPMLRMKNVTEQMYSLCILLYYRQRKTVPAVILLALPWKYMNWFLQLFLHLLFPPGTKLHLRSFLLFYSIRKSGVATHNFTSGRLSIKVYVHSVHCFSLKNLNENIKDAQCSNAIARGDLIHQMADYVFSETKTETKWNPVFRFLKGGGAYVSTK